MLTEIVGKASVAAPTLSSLTTNFGLAPLIGKPLAIVSDARLGARSDQAQIVERLLSISGEDSLTIDRKYLAAWTGRLPTRFMILTNELPTPADASGALAKRFILLQLKQSFYGREDPGLTDRLLTEASGILNWCREGYLRLRARGHFVQPASASEAIEDLEVLANPVKAFVRDRCSVLALLEIRTDALFNEWVAWCEANGKRSPGLASQFGKDLKAAFRVIHVAQRFPNSGKPYRVYVGIDLV